MADWTLDRVVEAVRGVGLVAGLVWIGLAVLTVALIVLMQTRWGRSKPLRKCVALSLLAHVLFALYATTIEIVTSSDPYGRTMTLRLAGDGATPVGARRADISEESAPWERFADEPWEIDAARAPNADPLPRAATMSPSDRADETPHASPLADLSPGVADDTENTAHEPPRSDYEPARLVDTAAASQPLDGAAATRRDDALIDIDWHDSDLLSEQSMAPPASTTDRATELPLDLIDPNGLLTPAADLSAERLPPRDDATGNLPKRGPAPVEAAGEPAVAGADPAAAPMAPLDAAGALDRLAPLAGDPLVPSNLSAAQDDSMRPLERVAPDGDANLPPQRRLDDGRHTTPELYRWRSAPDRAHVVAQGGGSTETEAAVNAALRWLAANQATDGRWVARRHGAGVELRILGQDRGGAGAQADNGITALALLAFLGAGHTHTSGDFRGTVERGVDYLLSTQHATGHLGGGALANEFMYCHGMSALALSEAYAMSGDERLAEPVRRAIGYTLFAQHRTTGGWRYRPGDTGDTSQLGWQLMALKSAQMAGIEVPEEARSRAMRFLKSVSFGAYGGLACYRPGERASRTMTAEALVCRQFLGIDGDRRTSLEAADYILTEPPGAQQSNLYYWYYATLALYQVGGDPWEQWNAALKATLVARQRKDGDFAGSWDTSDLWGGYGGRVYTTALGALCLEVYYRFLPLHVAAGVHDTQLK